MIQELFVRSVGSDPVIQGLAGGIIIASLNLLGAMLILFWKRPSERALDGALGFAAGVMLAASFTSLILPGVEEAGGTPLPVLVGIFLGAVFLDQSDRWVPHIHYLITGRIRDNGSNLPETDGRVHSVILFTLAVTIHNMPEGLAVGVGFGSGDLSTAIPLMLAIGLQNVPEGFAVAVAARNAGLGDLWYAGVTGGRAGLVEIPLAVLGAWAITIMEPLLPYAMGFAAGGMVYVISDEIIPETHRRGYERAATIGLIIGLIVMLYLDISLTT